MNAEQQSLMVHLLELRRRLLWALLGFAMAALVLLPFAQSLYTWVAQPLMSALPSNTSMIATSVIAPFFVPIKVALALAFLLSLPNTLYQVWAFVAPALYQNEKRLVLPLIVSSTVLFGMGMVFCYFVVFPVAFRFFAGVTPDGVHMAPDIDSYLSFIINMFLAFGLTFEVPMVVVLLNQMGVVSLATLKAARRYVVVGAFVCAAVLTPPDVLSQVLLALPMIGLYELGIWVCARWGRFARSSDGDDHGQDKHEN